MNFVVSLTVHLGIFISVINHLDAQNFCFTISLFHASTCFKHMRSKHVEAWNKLIVKQNTYRCDDTTDCVMQFWPPDDEHMCSKHVEAWNKFIVKQKFCTSSWLITEIKISLCVCHLQCHQAVCVSVWVRECVRACVCVCVYTNFVSFFLKSHWKWLYWWSKHVVVCYDASVWQLGN